MGGTLYGHRYMYVRVYIVTSPSLYGGTLYGHRYMYVCVYIVTSPSLYGGTLYGHRYMYVRVYIVTSPSLYGGDPLWAQVHVCMCIYRNSIFFVVKIFSYAENVLKYFKRI